MYDYVVCIVVIRSIVGNNNISCIALVVLDKWIKVIVKVPHSNKLIQFFSINMCIASAIHMVIIRSCYRVRRMCKQIVSKMRACVRTSHTHMEKRSPMYVTFLTFYVLLEYVYCLCASIPQVITYAYTNKHE